VERERTTASAQQEMNVKREERRKKDSRNVGETSILVEGSESPLRVARENEVFDTESSGSSDLSRPKPTSLGLGVVSV